MKKYTIAIIGGYNGKAIINQGNKEGVNVIYHNGERPRKKDFDTIAKQADSVVVLINICGHQAQDLVKVACKKNSTPIVFTPSKGASSAIRHGVECIQRLAA